MKTTIDIHEAIMDRLRERAAREHTTMREIVEAALRQFLSPAKSSRGKFRLRDGSFRGNGLAPGVREGDWEQIREIIYEGRGGAPEPRRSRKAG